jgi:hypothetical protein
MRWMLRRSSRRLLLVVENILDSHNDGPKFVIAGIRVTRPQMSDELRQIALQQLNARVAVFDNIEDRLLEWRTGGPGFIPVLTCFFGLSLVFDKGCFEVVGFDLGNPGWNWHRLRIPPRRSISDDARLPNRSNWCLWPRWPYPGEITQFPLSDQKVIDTVVELSLETLFPTWEPG